jgi:hypothetical protein
MRRHSPTARIRLNRELAHLTANKTFTEYTTNAMEETQMCHIVSLSFATRFIRDHVPLPRTVCDDPGSNKPSLGGDVSHGLEIAIGGHDD